MKNLISILFLTALTVAITEAQSSYLKFEGIEGEVTEPAYRGWSELVAFSQGFPLPQLLQEPLAAEPQ
jgi:hypothetical protein